MTLHASHPAELLPALPLAPALLEDRQGERWVCTTHANTGGISLMRGSPLVLVTLYNIIDTNCNMQLSQNQTFFLVNVA